MLLVFAGLLGLAIGSFLNVVVYRVPAGRSLTPDSACPNCGTAIRKRDNIPVVSWLILRGKCRGCAQPISARYPLVEAGTAIAFVLVTARFGPAVLEAVTPQDAVAGAIELGAFLTLTAVSIALALIDLDTKRLPNVIVVPCAARRHPAARCGRGRARRPGRARRSAARRCRAVPALPGARAGLARRHGHGRREAGGRARPVPRLPRLGQPAGRRVRRLPLRRGLRPRCSC